jgi:hypothetical protein
MKHITASAILLLLCAAARGAESEPPQFLLGPRVGPGELRIDAGQRIGPNTVEATVQEDTAGIGGTLEYRAPFGFVVEVGLFSMGSVDWFDGDDYGFTEYFGSIGYEIELGSGFSLIPRVGRARWKLESDETWFFDDDDTNPAARGYQNYWEITALKRLNERVSLGVSHKQNSYDFGNERVTVFTAMFDL